MSDHENVPIGNRLRKILTTRGMSQASLASVSGLSKSDISRYLSCKRTPTAQSLEILARSLDTDLGRLVAGTDVEHLVSPELQFVSREQHETVVHRLTAAQTRIVNLEGRAKAKDEQLARLSARLSEVEDELDKEREAKSIATQLASDRLSALTEMKGQLRESQEHVFQLEQTIQGQAGYSAIVKGNLMRTLGRSQTNYTTLKASYDALHQDYVALWVEHTAAPPPKPAAGPLLLAGFLGAVCGVAGNELLRKSSDDTKRIDS